jgi:hypothetical protein
LFGDVAKVLYQVGTDLAGPKMFFFFGAAVAIDDVWQPALKFCAIHFVSPRYRAPPLGFVVFALFICSRSLCGWHSFS